MNSKLAAVATALALSTIHSTALGVDSIPIRVQVEPAGGSKVQIQLTNASSSAVTMYGSRLPWGTRTSMIIAAVKLSGTNELLSNTPVIDDPPPGEVTIAPGQTLTGEIDLAPRFHQTWRDAQGNPLLVFWSYQLHATNGGVSNRVNGALEMMAR